MARTGLRKLENVPGTLKQAWPVHVVIRNFLEERGIKWDIHLCTDPYNGREFHRYFVHLKDLERAREVLPVVKELRERISAR